MIKAHYRKYLSTQLQALHGKGSLEFELFRKYYHKNYSSFLPKSKKALILDIGFGMGHFLYFLKKSGYNNYIGIDLSQESVKYCIENNLGTNKNLLEADVSTYLKSTRSKFDVVVMNDVIEHIDKDRIVPTLISIKKSLSRNGKIIIKTVNAANPITGCSSRYFDITHTICFTPESLSQVIRLAGFNKFVILPQDIWVINPVINLLGKIAQTIMNNIIRLMYLLYGRTTTRVFTKDMIAVITK